MTKKDIVTAVGEDRYRAACRTAQEIAADPRYGKRLLRGPADPDLADEIADLIWDADAPPVAKLRVLFEIYDEMPAYGHLMYLTHVYDDLSPDEHEHFWNHLLARLASDQPGLHQPIQYFLWCDLLEDPTTVADAWARLAGPGQSETILRRVLPASGPVPWELKRPVYDNLLPAPRWHEAIFESLLASAIDIFGSIDKKEARRLLGRLRLPRGHHGRDELERRLG